MSSPLSLAPLTGEWQQSLWAPPDASPRTEEPKTRKRSAVSQQQRDATGATGNSTYQTQQALAAMRGSDAPAGTLERFGKHTEKSRLLLSAAKKTLTTKPNLVEKGVNGELYCEAVLKEVEKVFCQDYEESLAQVWALGAKHGMWLREGDHRRAMVEAQTNHQLRTKLTDLEEKNSSLQLMYDQAVDEIRKLHMNDPVMQAVQESEGLDLSQMQEYVDSLFTDDGFIGEISGEVAF